MREPERLGVQADAAAVFPLPAVAICDGQFEMRARLVWLRVGEQTPLPQRAVAVQRDVVDESQLLMCVERVGKSLEAGEERRFRLSIARGGD